MKAKLLIASLLLLMAGIPARSVTVCGGTGACIIPKTPYEQFVLNVDFTAVIGSDPFTLSAVVATNRDTNQDSTSQVIASSPTPGIVPMTDKVAFAVTGGSKGQTHVVGVRVTDTATGEKFEGQITVVVQ